MASMNQRKLSGQVALWLLFAALTFAVTAPMFKHLSWWGVHDWPQFYCYYGIPRRAVVEHGELPGWNPHYYGGNVQYGHPDDPSLSPLFIPILLFGEVIGSKIDIVLMLMAGMYSMWLLARRFCLSPPASLFAAAVWALNGWHAYHFAVGHMDHLTFLLQPLAVYFLIRAIDHLPWAAAAGAVIALMTLSGGPYPFVFTSILLVVAALALAAARNSAAPLLAALAALGFAVGFAAVKLLATVEFALFAEGSPPDVSGTPLGVVWRALFDSSLPMPTKYGLLRWGAWEYAAFIGFVPAAAFLFGAVAAVRKAWPWLAVAAVFLLASLGSACPINFFALFTAPPMLSGMHVPFRFIVHFILVVAVVGAFGLDRLGLLVAQTRLRKAALPLVVLAVAISTANLLWMHYNRPVPLYELASFFAPPAAHGGELPQTPPKHNISKEDGIYIPATHANAIEVYLAFLENRRLRWGYDAVHLPTAARFPDGDGYRGEVWLADPGPDDHIEMEFTMSTALVNYSAADAVTVILNQNYHPGWKARSASGTALRVGEVEGLVAARAPAGQGRITFKYQPATRPWGLVATLMTAIVAAVVTARYNRKS